MKNYFHSQIKPFSHLLQKANPSFIEDAYARQYLEQLLLAREYFLRIYSDCLQKAFPRMAGDEALIDFGCGNGLLALFAKFCGIKKVYAVDRNTAFLDAAKQLSAQVSVNIDDWINSNEETIVNYFPPAKPNALIATDVIEHIYNPDKFLSSLRQWSGSMKMIFTTSAVNENPFIRMKLKQSHKIAEWKINNPVHSALPEFAGLSYLEARKKMIEKKYPALPAEKVLQFARQTRGLMRQDIFNVIDGKIHYLPSHPTNTCDPLTGSWAERLLPLKTYLEIFNRHHCRMYVSKGYYNEFRMGVGGAACFLINRIIPLSGFLLVPFLFFEVIPGGGNIREP